MLSTLRGIGFEREIPLGVGIGTGDLVATHVTSHNVHNVARSNVVLIERMMTP